MKKKNHVHEKLELESAGRGPCSLPGRLSVVFGMEIIAFNIFSSLFFRILKKSLYALSNSINQVQVLAAAWVPQNSLSILANL